MALTQSDCQDFVLEVIGVMGNLALPDLDYSQILHRCNLIPWIRNSLVPGKLVLKLVSYNKIYRFFILFLIYFRQSSR
jgi:hypothetical protein